MEELSLLDQNVRGLEELGTNFHLNFLNGFKMEDPFAQRAVYAMCEGLAPDMTVVSRSCWISDFRRFLLGRAEMFPTYANEFYDRFAQFTLYAQTTAAEDDRPRNFWLDENGRVEGTYISFEVATPRADEIDEVMARWEKYIEQRNGLTPFVPPAWLASPLLAEFQERTAMRLAVIKMSSIATAVTLFAGVLYGLSPGSAFAVMICMTLAVLYYVVLWSAVEEGNLGVVDLIALSAFINGLISPLLRVVHQYACPKGLPLIEAIKGVMNGGQMRTIVARYRLNLEKRRAKQLSRSAPETCACGSTFYEDSIFCRRCGAKRPSTMGSPTSSPRSESRPRANTSESEPSAQEPRPRSNSISSNASMNSLRSISVRSSDREHLRKDMQLHRWWAYEEVYEAVLAERRSRVSLSLARAGEAIIAYAIAAGVGSIALIFQSGPAMGVIARGILCAGAAALPIALGVQPVLLLLGFGQTEAWILFMLEVWRSMWKRGEEDSDDDSLDDGKGASPLLLDRMQPRLDTMNPRAEVETTSPPAGLSPTSDNFR
jgi:hypothetical protein